MFWIKRAIFRDADDFPSKLGTAIYESKTTPAVCCAVALHGLWDANPETWLYRCRYNASRFLELLAQATRNRFFCELFLLIDVSMFQCTIRFSRFVSVEERYENMRLL